MFGRKGKMKNGKRTIVLISAIFVISSFVISTTMANPDNANKAPPKEWEAHPPIHIHGAQTGSPVGLSPTQIRHAYGFDNLTCSYTSPTWPNSSLCGSGQTIAIVDAFNSPTISSDLTTFSSTFGLPPCNTNNGCLVIAKPQNSARNDPNWAVEISLDVEWAHAIAPGAKILLVEARSNSFSNLLGAVDYAANQAGVHQVSMSWGGSEFSGESSYDTHFKVPGVSFFASSGDQGSILWPAVSPLVIGVGGTTLSVDALGNVINETTWSGSGGGISLYVPEPVYQSSFSISSNNKRGIPDVSYNADPNTGVPVYDSYSYGGGWGQVGGTSAGAPQWNALYAIVNGKRSTPLSSNNLATSPIYTAATGATNYGINYRDITIGSNSVGFSANTGYDLVTGLGSPSANNLVPYLQTN